MVLRARFTLPPDRPQGDEILILGNATWADYERLLEERGDRSAPRIAYLEGAVEIMSPSRDHEKIKTHIGHLVAAWCLHVGVEFRAVGSWTLKDEAVARGVEPDECYVIGIEDRERPHLAIEVEWTRGGLDKLEIYRLLDVSEVWRWRKDRIRVYVLRGEEYHEAPRSEVLPELDLTLLASFLDRPRTSQAIREYTEALRALE
ncbi:MAG: Uma2 family endonuclease [Deltaproteobacteria bacterium HGW-Deltaproteobacteria-14]|jgi:Uma2 family endonuclease|nr:MAG: Uma2 family endonuclease [Deltaproteobacteria bacterium HGW-Deltaproteobacteria-14]